MKYAPGRVTRDPGSIEFGYQLSRADICMVRGLFWLVQVGPVRRSPAQKLLPGMLNTLKKSACTRSLTLSLIESS